MNIVKAGIATQLKKIDKENRILTMIGSNEIIDRDQEVILAEGWELENFKKNPVILFAHDAAQPPVAKAIDIRLEEKNLVFDIQFPKAGDYPFADTLYKLYEGGFMSASSVRFIPKEWEDGNGQPAADGKPAPLRTYKRQELVELSLVPVPANPAALITSRSFMKAWQKNAITGQEWDQLIEAIKSLTLQKSGEGDDPPSEPAGDPDPEQKPDEIKAALKEISDRLDAFELAFNERLELIDEKVNQLSEKALPSEDDYISDIIRGYREEQSSPKGSAEDEGAVMSALEEIKKEKKKQ